MTTRDLSVWFPVSDEFIADNPDVDSSAVEVAINFMAAFELAASSLESPSAPLGTGKAATTC